MTSLRERLRTAPKSFRESDFRTPFLIWLYSRFFYYASAFVVAKFVDLDFAPRIFRHWDVGWYLSIIKNGYMHEVISEGSQIDKANWAFFPVMPFLVRIVSEITNQKIFFVGYAISNISLLVAFYYLYKFLIKDFSPRVVRTTLIFIALSPASAYFTTVYTESLFLALLAAMIFYAREHRWILAGICGAFLTGTRNTGIFMLAIYIFEFLRSSEVRKSKDQRLKFFIGLVIFPLGLVVFMVHLWVVAGDPLAFYNIQREWGGPPASHFEFVSNVLRNHEKYTTFIFLALLSAVFSCIYLFVKRRFVDFLVLLPITLISLVTLRIQYRFFFALYPIYLVVAVLADKRRRVVWVLYFSETIALLWAIKMWITGVGPT
jgi:Gpi18-like mannosyltransferase